ncbi:MAG: hypothetical protein IPL11_19145 [Candidatus Accumulibacter sp.]|nr:hypothetical protein [Accumulibacter sp.]
MRKVWFRLLCATWLLIAGTPVRAEVRVVDDSGARRDQPLRSRPNASSASRRI